MNLRMKLNFGPGYRRALRLMALSLLSMTSIQAAAFGPPSPEQRAKMAAELQAACATDFQNFCPTATDRHEKFSCLRTNEKSLSNTCSTWLVEMKAHRPPGPPPGRSPGEPPTDVAPSASH